MSEIKNEIKAKIVAEGMTMQQVVEALNEKHGRNDSIQNFSAKLTRGTIKYAEVKEVAGILGYKIEWIKK